VAKSCIKDFLPFEYVMEEADMRNIITIIILTILTTSTVWARGAYKWTDADGVVHYSDQLRSDNASVISIPVHEPDESDGADQGAADKSAAGKSDSQKARHDEQSNVDEKKLRKINCAKAKEQLEINQRMTKMYRLVDGERHYLSELERDEVIKRSHEDVSYWCK
jgi:hypothetical protein